MSNEAERLMALTETTAGAILQVVDLTPPEGRSKRQHAVVELLTLYRDRCMANPHEPVGKVAAAPSPKPPTKLLPHLQPDQ